ncbi:MAG TPA: hydrogenase maturation protease [Candidatus Methanoperedenaceae archaeon]|nr:hydrogenase maturation protease [Candidatus Methanoperedenaceae archaeon]
MVRILGCGNILMGDDGVGVHVLGELRKMGLDAEILDAGTGGLDLVDLMAGADRVILIDAVRCGGEAGTVYRFSEKDIPRGREGVSLHDIGIPHAIELGRTLHPDRMPSTIVLIGVEIGRSEMGIGLTEKVKGAISVVVEMVKREVNSTR